MIYLTLRVYKIMTMQTGDLNEMCDTIYFAGCSVGCPFCFNKEVAAGKGMEMSVNDIVNSLSGVEWVSFIGGEPLEQPIDEIVKLVYMLHNANKKVCLFTSHMDAWKILIGRMIFDYIHIDLKLFKKNFVIDEIPYLNETRVSYGLVGQNYDDVSVLEQLREFPIYIKANLLNEKQDGRKEYEALKSMGFLKLYMNERIKVTKNW